MVVARARGEPQSVSGSLQSLCWGSSAAGAVLSAYFSGSLVEQLGPRCAVRLPRPWEADGTSVPMFA